MSEEKLTDTSMRERVLGTIEKEHIEPKPRWHFLLKEWVVWLAAALALVLGSIATGLSLYIYNASHFIERQIELSSMHVLFNAVPFLWIVLFAVAIFYGVYAVRETRRGYRWNPSWLVALGLLLSIGIGASAHAFDISQRIDRYLLTEVPLYGPLSGFSPDVWMNPASGIVAGLVEEVREAEFVVRQLDGELKEILTTPDTSVKTPRDIHEGMYVRVVGTTTTRADDEDSEDVKEVEVFEAEIVEPFRGRGGGPRSRQATEEQPHTNGDAPGAKHRMQDVR